MKQIFTLFTSLLFGLSLLAADVRPKSTLTIKSVDRSSIKVVIDGRRFEPLDNYVRIQGIDAGYHTVKIYREKFSGPFSIFGKRYEVVFNSSVSVKPRTDLVLSVDRFGRTTMNEIRAGGFGRGKDFDDGNRKWDRNYDFDYGNSRRDGDYDNGRDNRWGNQDRDSRDGRFDSRDNRGYNDDIYNKAMSDFEFSRVLNEIQKEWLENNKMKSASQIISANYFTTAQVKQMVQMFSFENNKLELAKLAYTKTVDQRNYLMINDVFAFNSSKDELARYIRSH